jgi:hypothetical protein
MPILETADGDSIPRQPPGPTDRIHGLRRTKRFLREAIQGERAVAESRLRELFDAKIFRD